MSRSPCNCFPISTNLKIACHNVEGVEQKLGEPDYVNYIEQFDIYGMVETWTGANFDFTSYFNSHTVLHSPGIKLSKMGRRSGGVILLIKDSLMKYVTRIDCNFDNTISIKIENGIFYRDRDLIITLTYIPPYNSPYYRNKDTKCAINSVLNHLLHITEKEPNCDHLVLGDFNARIAEWQTPKSNNFEMNYSTKIEKRQRCSKDKEINFFSKNMIELCTVFDLIPLNGNCRGDEEGEFTFSTEQGKSVVDFLLMSEDLFQDNSFCFHVNEDRIESDHFPIQFIMPVRTKCNQNIHKTMFKTHTKLCWNHEKKDIFCENISNGPFEEKLKIASEMIDLDVDSAISMFNKIVTKAADCMKKVVRVPKSIIIHKKWFDDECKKTKAKARNAKKFHKITRKKTDLQDYYRLKSEYKKIRRDKRNKYKSDTKAQLLRELKNGQKFWNIINKTKQRRYIQPNIDMLTWKEYFEQLLNDGQSVNNASSKESEIYNQDFVNDIELDKEITQEEVMTSIHNLKSDKACGIDSICGEFLKFSEMRLVPFLTKLYNRIYDNLHYPEAWNCSIITPIYKKGEKTDPNNYRGISLLSVTSKVFTAILHNRLYQWTEKNEKLSTEQAGFRRNFSTIDHIFTLVSIIQHRMQLNKGKLYAAFIDYNKAFDQVDRGKLWTRLYTLNISTKMIRMIQAIYKTVKACVRWEGCLSESFMCLRGVKQGCILSPLLFSMLIDEVANFVYEKGRHGIQLIPNSKEIFSLLFADDVILLSTTPQGLQNQINNLTNKSKELGLTVNLQKSKVMVFRKGGFLSKHEQWKLDGKKLEVVNSYNYLGYLITTKISYEEACEELVRKSKGKILDIFKTMWSLGNINTSIFFQLYDCQIKPMVLYGSEIWGNFVSEILEASHLFALKRLLSVGEKTPNTLIYGETGRYAMNIDATISTVRYWLRISKLPPTRLPNQVLQLLYRNIDQIDRLKKENWLTKIRRCLVDNGFSEVWEAKGTQNEKAFVKHLKDKLIENFIDNWKTKLMNSDRFFTYRIFKSDFGREFYLDDLTIKRFRDCMIRFRLGINDLGVNRRYNYNERERYCPFCPNELEDEIHFLFVCEKYTDLRVKYLSGCYEFQNVIFLQDPNVNIIRKTAMYIFYSLKLREQCLEKLTETV